jgi:flavin-dependent dehydrogenase
VEQVDVVVVGARCAGSAAAAQLARAGRKVVVLDRMRFPSDVLSTHVLQPAGTSELAMLGALPRVLALSPSIVRWVRLEVEGAVCLERARPAADGTDFGLCVPRDLLDVELVASAREQGADVREGCTVEQLVWRAGRVAGVRYRDPGGMRHELRCRLVVGADGRRSTVAALAGVWTPYRRSRNGRGLVFRYMDDPRAGTRDAETYYQWREGDSIAFVFPTAPAGRVLVLFMGHRDEVRDARRDPDGYWARKLREHAGVAERVEGATGETKPRSTGETPAFFRASSGPGWALAGDAGHFKDPVTGQGMRDSLWSGRTLAEAVLPVLDDPAALDLAARGWEARRDRECLPAYHFANSDTRVERQSPTLCELVRDAGRSAEPDLSDLFGRARTPQQVAPLPRLVRATGTALLRGDRSRRETVARASAELLTELRVRAELRAGRFRSERPIAGSDHPNAPWPAPPVSRGAANELDDSPAAVAS